MKIADIKDIIDETLDSAALPEDTEIRELLARMDAANGDERECAMIAEEICGIIRRSDTVPWNLGSNEDLLLAHTIWVKAANDNDTYLLKYALIVLHNRYMLGDMLEQGFAAEDLMKIFIYCREHVLNLLELFATTAAEDPFYGCFLDKEDMEPADGNRLYAELIRAVLPSLSWLLENYPDYPCFMKPEDIEDFQNTVCGGGGGGKASLPKFSAFCRMLYAAPFPSFRAKPSQA